MNFKGHLVGGIIVAALWAKYSGAQGINLAIGIMAALVMACWPDIDTNSVIQDHLYKVVVASMLGLWYYGMKNEAIILGIIFLAPIMLGHRSALTHSFIAMIVWPLPLYFVASPIVYVAGVAGYASHLLLDGIKR